ncbi:MAG TPA: glycosyltransferase family 39 protein [Bacteroidales bacterium]|nr:glycosyltransferase family 39 protein [Bacteroidales bacterium]
MKWKVSSVHGNSLMILCGFIGFSIIMRFFSFFPSIISHDEGTFLVIARELFKGKIYFVDLIDTKPIGIFLLLGLFIKYISSSIIMIRLFTAIVIGFTSYFIYRISFSFYSQQKPAIAAGVIFIFFLSIFTHFGVFINPELFYTFLTAVGFYTFIHAKRTADFLLIGLLLGIGFILKYTVIFDLTAWLIYVFFASLFKKEKKLIASAVINCATACLGFLVPFLILIIYYYEKGHLKELLFYTFTVSGNIPVKQSLFKTILYISDFHLRFLPILFFFYYTLFKLKRNESKSELPKELMITWCLIVMVAVLLPGKPFGHYFIQLMLPVSIVAGGFFINDLRKPVWVNRIINHSIGTVLLMLLIAGNVVMQKHDYYDKEDMPKEVAVYLKPLLKPEDSIFTGNFESVLYYILQRDCPVRYVHRSLLCDPEHRKALQVNIDYEMKSLMQKDIEYIIMKNSYCYEPVNVYLKQEYTIIKVFPDSLCIYKRSL